MEQTTKLINGDTAVKWQDLTKVLKVGDTVYSKLHGVGVVTKLNDNAKYPIDTNFNGDLDSFTKYGFLRNTDKLPCITNIPFNPLTDPFPMPKFEPIPGEWYAFWDDHMDGFAVYKLSHLTNRYYYTYRVGFENCAPIEEALELFKSKYPPNEQS